MFDPEKAQEDWDKYARSEYEKFTERKAAELLSQQRRMSGAIRFLAVAALISIMGGLGAFAPAADLVVVGAHTGAGTTGAGVMSAVVTSVHFWQSMSSGDSSDSTVMSGTHDRQNSARRAARSVAINEALESLRSGSPTPQAEYLAERLEAVYGREALVKFMETGKLPRGVEFSHLFSAAEYPEFAHRSDLGVLTDQAEHRRGHHGGNTRIPLHGMPRGRR